MQALGIDLAGVPDKPTGLAVFNGKSARVRTLHTDREILETCRQIQPAVIAIDAPLSRPRRGSLRKCDRILIERGLRVFPPLFGGMKKLTERGIRLAKNLRRSRFEVIEIHPRTSGILLFGTPERSRWTRQMREAGLTIPDEMSVHEIDALVAALTGWFYLMSGTEAVGTQNKIVIRSQTLSKRFYSCRQACQPNAHHVRNALHRDFCSLPRRDVQDRGGDKPW